jgi:hypothetical protein
MMSVRSCSLTFDSARACSVGKKGLAAVLALERLHDCPVLLLIFCQHDEYFCIAKYIETGWSAGERVTRIQTRTQHAYSTQQQQQSGRDAADGRGVVDRAEAAESQRAYSVHSVSFR